MTAPNLRILRIPAATAAPGLLLGAQLSGLLFFLNPELPFAAIGVVRGALAYGLLLGSVTTVLTLPFLRGRTERAARLLPWSLSGALAVAALLHGMHASVFAYYLPPGINERLLKTAAWLTLGALISFYTALLHTLQGRPYGWRSRVGLGLIALAAVYVTLERREAYRPPRGATPLPSAVEPRQRPQLVVVGLEGATLDAVLPLAEQGELPFLGGAVRRGAYGHLRSLRPTRPEPLWTTVATGKLPYKHGVVAAEIHDAGPLLPSGRLRLLPVGIGFERWGLPLSGSRPVDGDDRRAFALWEILTRLGVPSGVIGWPAAIPPRGAVAFCFSKRFFRGEGDPALAQPRDLAERGVLFRIDAGEIDRTVLAPFGDEPPTALREALAGDLWRESLARWVAERRPEARALFLALPGLLEVSELTYGGFSAVEFEGVSGAEQALAAARLTAYYRHLDRFLGELWGRLSSPRLMVVTSAWGARAPGGVRRAWAQVTGGATVEGLVRDGGDGMLLLLGDGVRQGQLLAGAELVDLLPTLLYGLGFPIARDVDGHVLTHAYEASFLARRPLVFVPSYETLTEAPAPSAGLGGTRPGDG